MHSQQIRAGRALLSWSQGELAETSGVSVTTIKRMEKGSGVAAAHHENVQRIQRALETAGVEFIPENGGGPGVRLRK